MKLLPVPLPPLPPPLPADAVADNEEEKEDCVVGIDPDIVALLWLLLPLPLLHILFRAFKLFIVPDRARLDDAVDMAEFSVVRSLWPPAGVDADADVDAIADLTLVAGSRMVGAGAGVRTGDINRLALAFVLVFLFLLALGPSPCPAALAENENICGADIADADDPLPVDDDNDEDGFLSALFIFLICAPKKSVEGEGGGKSAVFVSSNSILLDVLRFGNGVDGSLRFRVLNSCRDKSTCLKG